MNTLLTAALLALTTLAQAQMTPVGAWHTIDDKSQDIRSLVRITDTPQGLSGRIEKLLSKDARANALCDACSDDRKGQAIIGLEIVRGGQKAADKDQWEGGKILDPENGRSYTLQLTPLDGGRRLQVRGYLGPFYRTQVWVRAPE